MAGKLDRENMAGSIYDKQYFTDEEMTQAQQAVDAAASGKTDWDSAHSLVEGLRAKYGYSGGEDGSKYVKLSGTGEKFTYADAPQYVRTYGDQINRLTGALLNRGAFSYDAEKDPAYQQYKDSYTRQGRQAMEDTLGKVSARTGGLASSYAGTAAQQTYDQYMEGLADKIPELRQLAYQMYRDEGDRQMQNISLLRNLDEDERQDYLTKLGQYNADRTLAYNQWNDDRNFRYKQGRDQVEDAWRQKEWDYNTGWDQKKWDYGVEQDERSAAEKKAAVLAAAGDFSGYRALGYTDAEIASMEKAYQEGQRASRSGGGGGKQSVQDGAKVSGIDRDSIRALGYGPISEKRLNELVASGEVKEIIDDGTLRFVRSGKKQTSSSGDWVRESYWKASKASKIPWDEIIGR